MGLRSVVWETRGVRTRFIISSALLLAACGGQEEPAQVADSVVGGELQNFTHPDIGRFYTPFGTTCTATLIADDIALTAAHCVRYESSGTGGGQVRFRTRSGTTNARVRAYRSYSTRPGRSDVALLKIDEVSSRIASPRTMAARAPRVGEAIALWGYGCTERGTRSLGGKTTISARYGSSKNLCKGDSGGPLLDTAGQIIGVNSAYNTVSGADVFALPSSLRSSIQAQVEAWGHAGSIFGTRPGNTNSTEATALSASARIWRQTAGLRACGQWQKAEDFSSGRYNAHRYRLTLSPGGEVSVSLGRVAGSWAPALVVASGSRQLAEGRDRTSGVTLRRQSDGRNGSPARLTLSAERASTVDVFVTGWAAVQSEFRSSLTRSARYRFDLSQSCGATPEPPASTTVRNLPFRTRADTRDGESRIDRYSCAPNTNEGGPELTYTIDVPVAGVIAARLSNLPAGVDVDVHIVVGDTCVSRGHWVASARVPAGRHRVIVDSWVDRSGRARAGAFDLEVGYTRTTDLVESGLSAVAADRALTAFAEAFEQGATRSPVLIVADLDQPAEAPRLLVYDLVRQAVLVQAHVGHGVGSTLEGEPSRVVAVGEGLSRSPVGLLLTAEREVGPDGPRLALDGIEPGFNGEARERGIQLVAAREASTDEVADRGAPGLTDGALTMDPGKLSGLLQQLEDGTLVILHFSDPSWLEASDYL